ncbi:MAG: hypothetical protein ACREJ3_12490, partial [Polyangiaceae bacterium]
LGSPGDTPAGASLEGARDDLGIDAGEIEPQLDPSAPAGDLKAEVERFTTIEACVAQRAEVDPVLGDALDAIGYGTFVHDACRVLGAAHANDARRCDAIDSSALRDRCRATVAELAATPDACPWDIADDPAEGRDPACVAIASRSGALCSAVLDVEGQATCQSVLSGSDSPCTKLRGKIGQGRCARQGERWRAALAASPIRAADAIDAAAARAVSGSLVIHEASNAGTPAATVEADLSASLARGVVLVEQREGTRFVIGPLTPEGPGWTLPSPYAGTSFGLALFAPKSERRAPGVTARIDRAELIVPNRLGLATPIARSTLSVRIEKLAALRGGAVVIAVDGDLQEGPSLAHVHAEESTFVRDVVRAQGALSDGGGSPRYAPP